MLEVWCNLIIKTFFMNFCISYVFIKIKNHKITNYNKKITILLINILISIFYATLKEYTRIKILNLIVYICYITIILKYIKIPFFNNIVTIVTSICISYTSFIIAVVINFIFKKYMMIATMNITIIEILLLGIIQNFLVYCFFRIKRFSKGFSFMRKDEYYNNIIGIIIGIITITLCVIYAINKNKWIWVILIICIGFSILFMLRWIKNSITRFYKERMKDRTVEIQEEQLKEKDEIISNLKQELSNVLEINHKYNRRLSAMERAVANIGNKLSFNEELANEYSDVLDSLQELSKEYKQEFDNFNALPKTNIFSIDNLLEFMKIEAIKNNIEFELEINCKISEMVDKHISKNKLETLLGDHISDSIIAINSSDSASRKIKVIIGRTKGFYEILILDTGIEFKIETLLKLGLERTTTHKESGGTGIGFITTFETLNECKASLIIEEYNKENNNYTKAIIVRFDNKNEYKVISERAKEIKEKDIRNRIIVEKSKYT